jgi:hypothetical protein
MEKFGIYTNQSSIKIYLSMSLLILYVWISHLLFLFNDIVMSSIN